MTRQEFEERCRAFALALQPHFNVIDARIKVPITESGNFVLLICASRPKRETEPQTDAIVEEK